MFGSVDGLTRADAVGVVEEFDHRIGFLHLLQLPSVPSQRISVVGGGVADGVVGNGRSADGGQLVGPHPLPAEQFALRAYMGFLNAIALRFYFRVSLPSNSFSKSPIVPCTSKSFSQTNRPSPSFLPQDMWYQSPMSTTIVMVAMDSVSWNFAP